MSYRGGYEGIDHIQIGSIFRLSYELPREEGWSREITFGTSAWLVKVKFSIGSVGTPFFINVLSPIGLIMCCVMPKT